MKHINKSLIITAVICLAVGATAMFLIREYLMPPTTETLLLGLSNEFNRKCPMMVDKITRFDNTSVSNQELRFSYTILNAVKDSVDSVGLHNYLEPIVKKGLTNNPRVEFLKQHHITIVCLYRDRKSKMLTEVRVKTGK